MRSNNAAASIITIGDELMIGQVIDTNSAWIAQALNREGIWLRRRVSVGDDFQEMQRSFDEESAHSRIILITGGLGPTADDITKPFLCHYFNTRLITHAPTLEHVRHLFEQVHKRPLLERNLKQAEVPENCIVIPNPRGTAPGMLFEKDNIIYVSMPGVPHEMKGMMTDHVIPMLRERVTTGHIIHRTLLTADIGESFLAEHISGWESQLPSHLKLAYLPGHGMVRLRITGSGEDLHLLEKELNDQFAGLKMLVSEWLAADEDLNMPQIVSKWLRENGKTMGTAESCTGGYIAHLLTREPGASLVYKGSVISYANEVKSSLLNVAVKTLATNGAVSEQTVLEMAAGALKALGTDYIIATSGIMGPDGGSQEKPVGTVWIAVGDKQRLTAKKLHLRYDRERNIETAAVQALNILRKFLAGKL